MFRYAPSAAAVTAGAWKSGWARRAGPFQALAAVKHPACWRPFSRYRMRTAPHRPRKPLQLPGWGSFWFKRYRLSSKVAADVALGLLVLGLVEQGRRVAVLHELAEVEEGGFVAHAPDLLHVVRHDEITINGPSYRVQPFWG